MAVKSSGSRQSSEPSVKKVKSIGNLVRAIQPRSHNQSLYLQTIEANTITFGIGAAGSGKTLLAVSRALSHLLSHQVEKIILTKPVIDCGRSIGYLPGNVEEKVDPYYRPLYDAVNQIISTEKFRDLKFKGEIEIAPLTYLRGRTLENSFIIIDECQNMTHLEFSLVLTRIGNNSKMVLTGDPDQIDLPYKSDSGLLFMTEALKEIDGVGVVEFGNSDIQRNKIVGKLIKAIEKARSKQSGDHQAAYATRSEEALFLSRSKSLSKEDETPEEYNVTK